MSSVALAQDDDELAPIARPPAKGKPPARPKPAARPKPGAVKPAPEPTAEDDDLAPLAARKGEVVVKLTQGLSNALVSIDGKDVGVHPVPPQALSPGEHVVKVRRLGFGDFVRKVVVQSGKTTDVDARLPPVTAVVSVTSDVPDAQVFVNGRLIGMAPLVDLEYPAGNLELSVRKEGFKEARQVLTLAAGRDYPVVVKFNAAAVATARPPADRPEKAVLAPRAPEAATAPVAPAAVAEAPLHQRWYFWAGLAAGVVVVAGIALAAVLPGLQPSVIPATRDRVCPPDGCDLWLAPAAVRSALSMSAGLLSW
ncbi:MAG: PEGA domain-containing protein [Myxococcaceae bacterium]|nr:PEGA domain-containing protein [Myxococcaceae bacterium]MCA3014404.1 PEGA domain-containing protein [Myxococcaceae bacterium]